MSNSIKETLQAILDEASEKIEQSDALDKLNDVRVNFLGKKGQLTSVLKGMKDVAPEDRPKVGQMVNEARAKIETMMEETKTRLEKELREAKMAAEVIDVTLPAKKANVGHRHPNTIALEEVERIFIGMGYEVVEGPEVEYADYNLIFRKIIRLVTNRIPSSSQTASCFVPRPLRYRREPWNRANCRSV